MKISIFFILLKTCAIVTSTMAQQGFNIPSPTPFELIEVTGTPFERDDMCPVMNRNTNQEYPLKGKDNFFKVKGDLESIRVFSEVDYIFTSETDSMPKSKILYEYDADWNLVRTFNHKWDIENEVWVYNRKEKFEYYDQGNRTLRLGFDWDEDNESWVYIWKVVNEYNAQGKMTFHLVYTWDKDNEVWVYNSRREYEYDNHGNYTLLVQYVWNSSKEIWVGLSPKFEHEYDSLGNNTLSLWYNWDHDNGLWAYERKVERIYTDDGKQTLQIFHDWDKDNEVWDPVSKDEYEYDFQNGNLTIQLQYAFDSNNEVWKYSGKTEYEYNDEGKKTLSLGYSWDSGNEVWSYKGKTEYEYDEEGKEILTISYSWDSNNEVNVPSMKYEYEYDEHGNMTLDMRCRWDKDNEEWILDQKYEYKYESYGNRILLAYSADIINHYFKYEYAYDLQGNMTVFVSYDRDRENDIWVLTDKTFYNYLTTHAVNFAEIDTTVDSKFEIPIQTSEIYVNENITSFQFDIEFDNSVLQYTGASVEGTIAEGGSIEVDSDVDGILSVYYSNSDAITGAGDIVLLEFIALASDTTTLFIADAYFNNYILKDITNGIIIIKDTPTTIPSITEGRGEVMIYPIPANNELFVTGLSISSMIVIYDLTGKQLFSVAASSETEKLDVSILKGGIYIIEVKDKESRRVTRFLKR